MKIFIIIPLVFVSLNLFSQESKTDGLDIKLREYKHLYEQNLISKEEYEKLKHNLLFENEKTTPLKTDNNIDSNFISELKKEYKANFIGGTILLSGGISAIAGGIYYKNHKLPNLSNYVNTSGNLNSSTYNAALKDYRAKKIITFTIGGISMGVGLALEILGIHNKKIYLDKNKSISLGMSNQGIGTLITFH